MKLDIHVDSEVWCWRPNCPDSRRRRKRTRRGSAKVAKKKKTQSIIWLKFRAHAADHPLYLKHYQSKLATEPSSFQMTLMHLMTRCFRTSRNACTHKKLTCGLKPTWKHCENATLHIRSIGIINIKGLNIKKTNNYSICGRPSPLFHMNSANTVWVATCTFWPHGKCKIPLTSSHRKVSFSEVLLSWAKHHRAGPYCRSPASQTFSRQYEVFKKTDMAGPLVNIRVSADVPTYFAHQAASEQIAISSSCLRQNGKHYWELPSKARVEQ